MSSLFTDSTFSGTAAGSYLGEDLETISCETLNCTTLNADIMVTNNITSTNYDTYLDGTTSTVGAATEDLYSVITTTGKSFLAIVNIVARASTNDSAVFKGSVMGKNTLGTLTLSSMFDTASIVDAGISASTAIFAVATTSITVQVTGHTGKNINWHGELKIISV